MFKIKEVILQKPMSAHAAGNVVMVEYSNQRIIYYKKHRQT